MLVLIVFLHHTVNMGSSDDSREVKHLLSVHDDLSYKPVFTRRPMTTEQSLEASFPPPDFGTGCTVDPGSALSEVSDILSSRTTQRNYTPTSLRQRTTLAPWTLRRAPLIDFIACLITLVAVLEALHVISKRHQGLTTSTTDDYYPWKHCPTASKREPVGSRQIN